MRKSKSLYLAIVLETLSTTRAEISLALEKERAIVSYFSVGIGTKKLKEIDTEAKNATAESLKQKMKKKDEFQAFNFHSSKRRQARISLCVALSFSLKGIAKMVMKRGVRGFIKGRESQKRASGFL